MMLGAFRFTVGIGAVGFAAFFAFSCTTGEDDPDGTTSSTTSSSGTTSSGTGGGPGTTSSSSSSGGGEGPVCDPSTPAHPGVEEIIDTVTGKVVDLGGAPVDNILTDVCGTNICLSGHTQPDGTFNVKGKADQPLVDVALIVGAGRKYAKMAGQLPSKPSADFGTISTVKLPDFADGVAMAPGSAATQNGVTLTIEAGASVKYDALVYGEDSERGLRVVTFKPGDGNFPLIDPALKLELMIGIAPINTVICPAPKLTFDNTEGWTAGAGVEFFYNGYNTFDHWAAYGGWTKVAEGKVSEDGKTVSTKDGNGIPELGMLGVRLK